MRTRLALCLATSWFVLPAVVAYAADTHEGKVVSVQEGTGNSDGKLVMTDKDGKEEHSHQIPANARIMRDDKTVKLSDLKKGDFIKVSMNNDGKITELAASQRSDRNNDRESAHERDREGELPRFLSNLNLTAEQKEKLKSVCKECQGQRESAWRQFGERYREAVLIEASMLASIEDCLTEEQKKHIHHQRDRISNNDEDASNDSAKNDKDDKNDKAKRETARADQNDAGRRNTAARGNDKNGVMVEEITIIGVNLSPDQEQAAEEVQENYVTRLRKLNREMEQLHGRLVALETDRLLQIEQILTKEQRDQLRKDHQKMGHSAKHSASIGGGKN